MIWVLVVCGATVAHADPKTARELYERGTRAYNLQDFTTALELFKQAYDQKPDPVLLFNIAQCQRQLGQYEAASKSYRAFLNESPKAPNREDVKAVIKAMDDAAREQRAKEPPLGTQRPYDGPKTTTAPDATATSTSTTTTAGTTTVRESLPPARPWYKNGAAMGLTVGGVVLVAVGGGLAGFGEARRSDQSTLPSLPERNRAADDAAVFRPTGYALLGVGAASLVTGVILFSVGSKRSRM